MPELTYPLEGLTSIMPGSKFYHVRDVNGDIEPLRSRVANTVERLGYTIIDNDETSLVAKREAVGWAPSMASANILDYGRTLTVKLRRKDDLRVNATLEYQVHFAALDKYDRTVLSREADAIFNMAVAAPAGTNCGGCGTASLDDSRFCRRCGASLSRGSADLELARVSGEVRAALSSAGFAFTSSILGVLLAIAGLILSVPGVEGSPKARFVIFLLAGICALLIMPAAGFCWYRLRQIMGGPSVTVPNQAAEPSMPPMPARTLADEELDVSPGSITDSTTELLKSDSGASLTNEFDSGAGKHLN